MCHAPRPADPPRPGAPKPGWALEARGDRDRPGRPPFARTRPKGQHAFRRNSTLEGRARLEAQARRDAALVELAALDRRLAGLTTERVALLDELEQLRDELWPMIEDCRVARPPAFDAPPIPPAHGRARSVAGKHLRWICLVLLKRHGPQRLRDLHALLHQHGYQIGHHHPVKALADAMRLEVGKGRARRVQRGVYALMDGFRPRRGRHGHPSRLADELARDEVPRTHANGGLGPATPVDPAAAGTLGPPHVDPALRVDPDQWVEHPGFEPPG